MTVTWVLESNVFAEVHFDAMVDHLKANAIPYHVVRIIPMIHEIEGKVPEVEGPCVVIGSIGAHKLALRSGWTPGVFYDEQGFAESTLVERLGDLLVNPDAVRMSMTDVSAWAAQRDPDSQFFIKPDLDTKEFPGAVITAKDFDAWLEKLHKIGYLKNNDFDVVVSEPKKIGCEWRLVVVDGKVADGCLYKQWQTVMPERTVLREVQELVEKAVSLHSPAQAFVVDVAQVYDDAGEYVFRVIEYNTLNSAGLYACRPEIIIDAINRMLTSGS